MANEGYAVIFIAVVLGAIGYLSFECVVINSYSDINSWTNCNCFFFKNDTTVITEDIGTFSSVKIQTIAQCPAFNGNEAFQVTIEWPPKSVYYNSKSGDQVHIYESGLFTEDKHDCYINPDNNSEAVTENVNPIAGHIVGMILSILFLLVSAITLVVFFVFTCILKDR